MRIFSLGLFILLGVSAYSQNTLKEADEFFNNGNFNAALTKYLKVYEKDSNNVTLRHNIGVCYLNVNIKHDKALPYLEWVVKQPKFDDLAYFDLARAYLYANKFDKAIGLFRKFISKVHDENWDSDAKLYIKQCENAKELIKRPIDVTFINVGKNINTPKDEFKPYIPADESNLIFTSNRKFDSRLKTSINNVYLSEMKKSKWSRPRQVSSVNTSEDEFISGISSANNFVLIKVRRYEAFDDIYICNKKGTRISRPVSLGENINTSSVESGSAISPNGDTLIFASDRPGGLGGLDLWMSLKLPDDSWGVPVNLGKPVNSPYDDDFPYIMSDGKTMFFSSKGHNSMGDFDIFKTKLNTQSGKWSMPMNLGYPINTTSNNNTIAMSKNYRYGYVADIRDGGFGGLDIYRVVFNNTSPNVFIHQCTIKVGKGETAVDLPEKVVPKINVIDVATGAVFGRYICDSIHKKFILALPPGHYKLSVKAAGYADYSKTIFVPDMLKNKRYKLTVNLEAN